MSMTARSLAAILAGLLLHLTAWAAEPAPGNAQIAFANLGGIRDWRAGGDKLLYVQSRDRQWFRAELFGACSGLRFAQTIGFIVEPNGSFGRFSSILVDGRECPLRSLTAVEQPALPEGAGDAATQRKRAESAGKEPTPALSVKSARVPFAALGGIRSWRVADADSLYVEGRDGQWFQLDLLGVCPGLLFEESPGFVLEPDGSIGQFSSVLVNGRACPLASLVPIDPPADRLETRPR